MTYRGHVKDGVVVLDDPIKLPDGVEVSIGVEAPSVECELLPTLAERFGDIAGTAVGLPSDLAQNHDHYLHGLPKRV